MIRVLLILAVAVLAGAWADGAHPDSLSTRLTDKAPAQISVGYEHFRLKHTEFTSRQRSLAALTYSRDMMVLLQTVNDTVNAEIHYQHDGRIDSWDIKPAFGDCDDYVVTKLAILVADGVPRSALRIVFAVTDTGVNHLVLGVEFDDTTLILDNMVDAIEPWDQRKDLKLTAMETVSGYGWTYLEALAP